MSRNAAGTYSLPALNPVVSGTIISSTWANNTLNDIATALTNSLDRTGASTGMTGPLKIADGSAAIPSLSFESDQDTGMYWGVAAGDVGAGPAFVFGATELLRLAATYLYVPSTTKIRFPTTITLQTITAGSHTDIVARPGSAGYAASFKSAYSEDSAAAQALFSVTTSAGTGGGANGPYADLTPVGANAYAGNMGFYMRVLKAGSPVAILSGGPGGTTGGQSDLFLGKTNFDGLTDGYVYMQSKGQAPQAGDIPDMYMSNFVPFYYDSANHKLCIYSGGAWRTVTLA